MCIRDRYLNGIVMANYLGYEFIDAAEVIFFDEHGNFEAELTNKELSERLEHVDRAVIPGFYGSKHDGSIKTFSRGGSDVTGSIVARAIHADLYENWTDVSGFLVTEMCIRDRAGAISSARFRTARWVSFPSAIP